MTRVRQSEFQLAMAESRRTINMLREEVASMAGSIHQLAPRGTRPINPYACRPHVAQHFSHVDRLDLLNQQQQGVDVEPWPRWRAVDTCEPLSPLQGRSQRDQAD